MLISEVIDKIVASSGDVMMGEKIDPPTTRDIVIHGSTGKECTGIVTTCFASVDVIREAARRGANLIVSHESIFWNHMHNEPLADWPTFKEKAALLDEYGITVWRYHDHIHAGIPVGPDGALRDGIFYGLAVELGWEDYLVPDQLSCMDYVIPATPVREVAEHVVRCAGVTGCRIIGDADAPVSRIRVPYHLFGNEDLPAIRALEFDGIDCYIAMECVDFTASEYVRDASQLGHPRAIVNLGHFNGEEPGMKFIVGWLTDLFEGALPVSFVQSGDVFTFVTLPSE